MRTVDLDLIEDLDKFKADVVGINRLRREDRRALRPKASSLRSKECEALRGRGVRLHVGDDADRNSATALMAFLAKRRLSCLRDWVPHWIGRQYQDRKETRP